MDKVKVQELLDSFPENVDVDAFLEKIYLQKKIEDGERDVADGNVVSHVDAKKQLAKWLK